MPPLSSPTCRPAACRDVYKRQGEARIEAHQDGAGHGQHDAEHEVRADLGTRSQIHERRHHRQAGAEDGGDRGTCRLLAHDDQADRPTDAEAAQEQDVELRCLPPKPAFTQKERHGRGADPGQEQAEGRQRGRRPVLQQQIRRRERGRPDQRAQGRDQIAARQGRDAAHGSSLPTRLRPRAMKSVLYRACQSARLHGSGDGTSRAGAAT